MPSKTTPSEPPLPIMNIQSNQQEMQGDKIDELMKWLRLVLKHTKFSRLLPVLSECLTMEQVEMLISAKAAKILEIHDNVQVNDKVVEESKEEERMKVLQTFSFDGEGENDVEEKEEATTSDSDDINEQSNDSDEFLDHMKLEVEEEEEEDYFNDEVIDDDINDQTNELHEVQNQMKAPLKVKVRSKLKVGRPRKGLECRECDMVFDTRAKKTYHTSSIHSTRTFQCSVCQQHFSGSSSLKRHGLVHQDFGEFSCNVCNKVMKRKTHLVEHMRTHSGEKPFLCPDCPYRGSSSSLLAHHKRSKHRGGIKMLL